MAKRKVELGKRERWLEDMRKKGAELGLQVSFALGPGRHFTAYRGGQRLYWGSGTSELEGYLAGYKQGKERACER